MTGYFRAVAVDYDGTLTTGSRPSEDLLEAVAAARREGTKVVLVTGRILAELQDDFPEVREHFDLVVAENGAVIAGTQWTRALVDSVDSALDRALRRRGIPFRRGQVLLACDAVHDVAVLEATHGLGFDYQLVHNRSALMILPPGVSKGTGVFEALGDLRVSYHNAIGVGDAENDHALLAHCEVGVAVANAVDALKDHADLVLDEADGAGVAELLTGPVVGGKRRMHPRRFRLHLGTRPGGGAVELPASQFNLLVVGGSRSGKSYVTGLVAEQLVSLGYSVLVADPQGDHRGLGALRGVVMLGGGEPLPGPGDLARLLEHRFGSAVVDLSLLHPDDAHLYLCRMPLAVERLRAATGLPHWMVIDEAHATLGDHGPFGTLLESDHDGYCLATYRPQELSSEALAATDAVVLLPAGEDTDLAPFLPRAAEIGGVDPGELEVTLGHTPEGRAVLVTRFHPAEIIVFEPAPRSTSHIRHWHKYARARLPRHLRFYFRHDWKTPTGAAAANLEEFHRELAHCDTQTVHHHAAHGDFSRWLGHVVRDEDLADAVSAIERRRPLELQLEALRHDILVAIETRYLG